MKVKICIISVALTISACSSNGIKKSYRQVVDSSSRGADAPAWVQDSKLGWEESGSYFIKGFSSARGNERLNSCYELSKLEAKKALLSEVKENVKGILDTSIQSSSEDQEQLFSQAMSTAIEGQLRGLRFKEQYFERYIVEEHERIDCHVLSAIPLKDFTDLKRRVLYQMADADPRIKEALLLKQRDFFKEESNETMVEKKSKPAQSENEEASLAKTDK